MKTCQVGAELFRADGRTNMAKLIVTFCNIVKGTKTAKRDIQEEPS